MRHTLTKVVLNSLTSHLQAPSSPRNVEVPRWAIPLAAGESRRLSAQGYEVTVTEGRDATLISATFADAKHLDSSSFERCVADGYLTIRSLLSTLRHTQPVRFWNYLPSIHEPLDGNWSRYIIFNGARFKSIRDWVGGADQNAKRLPAATGVGHEGTALEIDCLAMQDAGTMLENPRQIPAIQYSAQFGPLPPSFSRATLVKDAATGDVLLLAAGTASIVGEASMHSGDLTAQLLETRTNLQSLLEAARQPGRAASGLAAFESVRVYYPRSQDASSIQGFARGAFGPHTQIEMVRADLCRPELLVEIEGVARLLKEEPA